jgi:hypothetical protein
MSKAETVRSGIMVKKALRLVKKDGLLRPRRWCDLLRRRGRRRYLATIDAGKATRGISASMARTVGSCASSFFPNGVHSKGYASQERDYKLAAKAKFDKTTPLDKAVEGKGFGEAVLSVFRVTNMLSSFEKTRLQDVLRGPHADDFVWAAARFTLDGGEANLLGLEQALKPNESAGPS